MARNDLSLIGLFLILALKAGQYNRAYPLICTKIIFHIIIGMIIYDIVWAIVMAFVWNHANDDSNTMTPYWHGLYMMHTLIYLFAFVGMAFKVVMLIFVFLQYREVAGSDKISFMSLLNFNYSNEKPKVENSDSMRNADQSTSRLGAS